MFARSVPCVHQNSQEAKTEPGDEFQKNLLCVKFGQKRLAFLGAFSYQGRKLFLGHSFISTWMDKLMCILFGSTNVIQVQRNSAQNRVNIRVFCSVHQIPWASHENCAQISHCPLNILCTPPNVLQLERNCVQNHSLSTEQIYSVLHQMSSRSRETVHKIVRTKSCEHLKILCSTKCHKQCTKSVVFTWIESV